MRTEQQVAAAIADARLRPPPIGGWTSYCQLVASLLAGQVHSREKDGEADHASTR